MEVQQVEFPGYALVTGASSGIGEAYARALAARGHALILVARRRDRLEALAAELRQAHGVGVVVEAVDLSVIKAASALIDRLDEARIDVSFLVNNAGFGTNEFFFETPLPRELAMIDLNCRALVELSHAIGQRMRDKRAGTIVHTSSVGGFTPCPRFAVYGATKAFILSFSEALALELAPFGVVVQTLCPGMTTSEFAHAAAFKGGRMPSALTETPAEVVENSLQALDRGRRSLLVSGRANRVAVALTKVLPRRLVYRVALRAATRDGATS